MTEIYPHGRRLTRVGNFLNVSTFSSLTGAILTTFAIVTMLYRPYAAPTIAIGLSVCAFIWILHGLRLRHRLAELVEVAAIRAGLQPVVKKPSTTK
jgi:hypothetical protein